MAKPWEKYANPSAGYGADPYKVAEEQRKIDDQILQREAAARAAAAADRAAAAAENTSRNSAQANDLAERKFAYEQSRRNDAPLTAKDRADAIVEYNKAIQLRKTIDDLVGKYRAGPGSTSGFPAGIADYFPTPDNAAFDSAANKLRGSVKAAQGFTGGEGNTMGEVKMNIGPFIPSSWEYDQTTKDKLDELYNQSDNAAQRTVALLGGVPDQYGNVVQEPASKATRLPFDTAPTAQDDDPMAAMSNQGADQPNRDDVLFGQPPSDNVNGGFVPYGGTSRNEPNPQWAGVNQAVKGMIVAGRPAAEIKAFMNSKGIAGDATTGIDEAVRYYQKTGKTNFGVDVENMSVPMSGFDQFRNNAPQTQLGTAAATAANAGGFGIPQMLAGSEGLDYLRSQNGEAAFVGDVAGVIGGTAALGKLGSTVAGKYAPRLLGGGRKSALARQVGTDATYGGIYGATTEGDPLTGALTGALTATAGSLGGQIAGKGLQKTFAGGGTLAAQSLRARGIPITLGQAMGGMAQRIENAATTIPFVGDTITKRYGEGFDAFNREAFREAGAPIGAQVDDIGAAGLDALKPQINAGYKSALQGANVPLDDPFTASMAQARAAGDNLPPDLKAKFDAAMANRVDPLLNGQQRNGVSINQDPNKTGQFFRVSDGGTDAGFIQMQPNPQTGEVMPFVGMSGIDPTMQGQGIGTAAYNQLAQQVPDLVPSPLGLSESATKLWRNRIAGMSPNDADAALNRSADYGVSMGESAEDIALRFAPLREAIGTTPSRKINGEQYQQAMRGLAGYKAEMTKPGFEADYRDALSGVQDSLKGVMMRQGGEGVVSGLRRADDAYRNSKVLGKAVDAARNGGRTGEVEMFAPSQLNDASAANAQKYGGNAATTNRPFYELATLGQKVLPSKLANSGTTERMLAGAGLLGSSTGGVAYVSDDPAKIAAPVGATSLLMLLGTKKGQQLLVKGLMDRPQSLKKAGGLLGGRKARRAIGGAITAPMLIE